MNPPIAILGAGAMASALALRLMHHGQTVRMYCIEPEVETSINTHNCNPKYLPGHTFKRHVLACSDLTTTLTGANVVFLAVPSFAVAEVMRSALPHLKKDVIIASITKGLDPKTLQPLIVTEGKLLSPLQRRRLVAIGGPAVAIEMAHGSPTGLIAASKDLAAAKIIKKLLEDSSIKVAISKDISGVGLASALKNPYAIALGFCDGLALPTNAKALILTIALEEIRRFLHAIHSDPTTASSLAGLGDLVVTGFSPHGRNRTYGERLVRADSADPKMLGLTTVEGIAAAHLAKQLARRHNVNAPLLEATVKCLRAKKDFSAPFVHYLKKLSL